MDINQIITVQKPRGRGTNTLAVTLDSGETLWVPTEAINMRFPAIKQWLDLGNSITPPAPKSVDPNRGALAYEPHPSFQLPSNDEEKVWRYVDLPKFISMLNKQSLFFSRGHILEKFDSKEGKLPLPNLSSGPSDVVGGELNPGWHEFLQKVGPQLLINCWHLNEYESSAMWDIYGGKNEGIAIQSNLKRLKNCFGSYKDYSICIGQINYIDHNIYKMDDSNFFNLFLQKQKAFDYEKEIRCIILDDDDISLIPDDEPQAFQAPSSTVFRPGFEFPICLEKLVEKIYISRNSPNSFLEEVQSNLINYGFPSFEVIRSEI